MFSRKVISYRNRNNATEILPHQVRVPRWMVVRAIRQSRCAGQKAVSEIIAGKKVLGPRDLRLLQIAVSLRDELTQVTFGRAVDVERLMSVIAGNMPDPPKPTGSLPAVDFFQTQQADAAEAIAQ